MTYVKFEFDEQELRRALAILKPDGRLFEIRFLEGKTWNSSGVFKDVETLVKQLRTLRVVDGANAYIVLNRMNDACYARKNRDHFEERMDPTTRDNDIDRYDWLLIDLDPERPSGTSSTNEQLKHSQETARRIFEYLRDRGWKDPIIAASGNGTHLLYSIDLPSTKESRELVKNCLTALDVLFTDDIVGVDVSVDNPSRICKLYGTVARKGADTPERPHRMSRILRVPDHVEPTPAECLQNLAEQLLQKEEAPKRSNGNNLESLDVRAWIAEHGVEVEKEFPWNGGTKWWVTCPFNPEHNHGDAAIIQYSDGKIIYKCFHNHCDQYHWQEFREYYEPGYKTRRASGRTMGWNDEIRSDATPPALPKPDPESVPGANVYTLTPAAQQAKQQAEQKGAQDGDSPPSWWNGAKNDSGIIDADFATWYAERSGWVRAGRVVRTAGGEIVTESDALRAITNAVSTLCPYVTFTKVKRLFDMTRIYLPEDKRADDFDICTAADLAGMDFPPIVFNVNELLPAGLTVLAAPPKTGKSWMCLALADAIATGSKFLTMDTRKGACLYCALEDSPVRVQNRLRQIGSSMPANLSIVTRGAKRLDSGLLLQLETWIKSQPEARLIIIDTLARVRPVSSTGLDAYNQDTATIAPLQALALKHGVSVVLVTHYRKIQQVTMDNDPFDRITGSNGLFAVADSAWLIYGKRGSDEMTFRTTGRDVTDQEWKIMFDKASHRWQVIGTAEAVAEQRRLDEYRASPLARTIRELVNENGGSWHGSAQFLLLAMAEKTGVSMSDPRNIGQDLSKIVGQLLSEDNIHFQKEAGGRRGRYYSFTRVERVRPE